MPPTAHNHRKSADEHVNKAEALINDDLSGVFDNDAGPKAITNALLAMYHEQRAHHITTEEEKEEE